MSNQTAQEEPWLAPTRTNGTIAACSCSSLGLMVALAAPAAAATNQISGVAFYDPGGVCPIRRPGSRTTPASRPS